MRAGFDVRVIANSVLKRAFETGRTVTNLHLNKCLFFIHVEYLRRYDEPLVSAKIEAWEYGPVFREVYNQFKSFRSKSISTLAKRVDYDSGELVEAKDEIPDWVSEFVESYADFYLDVPAHVLVDASHAKGGAWDVVWSHNDGVNVGMEITEEIIREYELPKTNRISVQ